VVVERTYSLIDRFIPMSQGIGRKMSMKSVPRFSVTKNINWSGAWGHFPKSVVSEGVESFLEYSHLDLA
jgi:hypothetical protein